MIGREQVKRARAGAAAIARQDATALAFPYFSSQFPSLPVATNK